MMKFNKIILSGLLFVMAMVNNPLKAAELLVGTGTDCGYSTILKALNSAASGDTISVAVGTYTGLDAQLFIDKSLTLKGGLSANCQVFTNELTVLQTDLTGAVIDVDVSGGSLVNISGFDISGSQTDALNPFTSGIHVSGAGTLVVENSKIHDNFSAQGAGISATDGVELFLQNNVEIYNNEATSKGGGIYCFACTLFAIDTVIGKSVGGVDLGNIVSNVNGQGGGIYMEMATDSFLGKSPNGAGAVLVNYNKSDIGSAIYLDDSNLLANHIGNTINFNQGQTQPAIGIVNMLGTSIYNIINGKVMNNTGNNSGGTVFSTRDFSELQFESDSNKCKHAICAEISNNDMRIFDISQQSNVVLNRIKADNNKKFAFIQTVLGNGLRVTNSVISNNNIPANSDLIKVFGGAETLANFTNVSIVNNTGKNIFRPGSGNKLIFDGGIIWGNTTTNLSDLTNIDKLEIKNSIIQYDPTGFTNTSQADPMFVDMNNGDYHLLLGSPAIDYFVGTTLEDMEGDARPQGAMHDAGADESVELFKDGFE